MQFIPVGMRIKLPESATVANTCAFNDTSFQGNKTQWGWANPANTRFLAVHPNDPECVAVSAEAMWQGTKIMPGQKRPTEANLRGAWRKNKGKRPIGAWNGPDLPLITTPGAARRAIYVPTYRTQIEKWLAAAPEIAEMLDRLRAAGQPVYLRDFDTGQGIDRNGPVSHAWILSVWLNTGAWPR